MEENQTQYNLEGTALGFSVFAIGTRAPSFEVTNASLTETTITFGEAATVTATIENRGTSTIEKTANLTLADEVANATTVTLDGGETKALTLSYTPEESGQYDFILILLGLGIGAVALFRWTQKEYVGTSSETSDQPGEEAESSESSVGEDSEEIESEDE